MKLESQIRRGVFGFAAFLALGLVAVAHGGQVRDPGMAFDPGMAQCDAVQFSVGPIADRGDAESHTDWRALLPAMMFPTRS